MGIIFLSCFNPYFYGERYCKVLEFLILGIQISYLAADSLFPDWKVWTQFLVECSEGLQLDGLAESHPIEVIDKY